MIRFVVAAILVAIPSASLISGRSLFGGGIHSPGLFFWKCWMPLAVLAVGIVLWPWFVSLVAGEIGVEL